MRENYREALYIGFAMGLNTTVWVFWVLTGFVVPDPYRHQPTNLIFNKMNDLAIRDLCSSAGILASALVTFTVMFLPKGRQLSLDNKVEVSLAQVEHQFYPRWSSSTARRTGPQTPPSTSPPSRYSLATKV